MITLRDVSKKYETGARAIQHMNITIQDGEFVFVMGKSGSGKSTLLRLLIREIEPDRGEIRVNDYVLSKLPRRHIPKYRRNIGMVFQDFRLLRDLTVYENVAFAQRAIGKSEREIKENVPEALRRVGISSKYKNLPHQLSGGERQRVAIARAIVNQPSILLADEPTGNLDEAMARDIMKLLEEINRNGTTVIVITHSREIAESMNKRIITMDRGIVIHDTKDQVSQAAPNPKTPSVPGAATEGKDTSTVPGEATEGKDISTVPGAATEEKDISTASASAAEMPEASLDTEPAGITVTEEMQSGKSLPGTEEPEASAAADAKPVTPETIQAEAVSEAGQAEAIPEADRAEAIPEADRAEAIPEADRAEAIPEAGQAEAILEANHAEAIPEANRAEAVPEAAVKNASPVTRLILEPENDEEFESAADNTAGEQ